MTPSLYLTRKPAAVQEIGQASRVGLPLIDQKRIELSHELGEIPTRSEVMRFALEVYLTVDLFESESDGRSSAAIKKKK